MTTNCISSHGRRLRAEFGRDGKQISRTNFFEFSFSHQPYFICLLPVSTSEIQYITCMTFFLKKNLYFINKFPTLHIFLVSWYFATHPITLLLEILGTIAWAVPHLKFLGDRPPSLP